jgi:hypothetical protein
MDQSFDTAKSHPLWETQDLLGGTMSFMPVGEAKWLDRVRYEVSRADYVVFDWACAPTDAMLEEFHIAAENLPAERLIFILSDSFKVSVPLWQAMKFEALSRDRTYWQLSTAFWRKLRSINIDVRIPG